MSKKLNFLVMMLLGILLSINQVWGADETLTISGASSGHNAPWSTSYGTNSGTSKTSANTNVSISYTRVGRMNTSIQIESGTTKGFYSTSVPSNKVIKSVKITSKTNSVNLHVSTNGTSWTDADNISTTTTRSYTTSDGYKYFKVTATSSYAQITNIIVTYTDAAASTPSTVTFDANGNGSCGTSSLKEGSVGAGVTLPSCTANPGYYFIGWATTDDATDAGSGMTASQTYHPSGNTTLYAVYGYEVEWYINGSKEETDQYKKGAALALPSADPDIDCGGKVFVGWTNEANKNYSHATNAPGVLFTSASGTVSAPAKYYAVYATKSGGADQWKKVAASAVNSAGVYAIITTDGHAFNGTISSGHGQLTSTAFSFDANDIATSAPDGTCEITFTAVTGGYTMYNASNGYLYASAASSGKLAWHNTESSYWLYKSSNWLYNSNSAYLRDYQNSSIRTYGSNNGSVIQFAKKVSSSTYTDD